MDKFVEQMKQSGGDMPTPINIEVRYDETLQKMTGTASEPVTMSEGATFAYLMQNIFMAHPDIPEKYPPGTLGMDINGHPPRPHSPLFDGDVVSFVVG